MIGDHYFSLSLSLTNEYSVCISDAYFVIQAHVIFMFLVDVVPQTLSTDILMEYSLYLFVDLKLQVITFQQTSTAENMSEFTVFIRKNTGHIKSIFWHIMRSRAVDLSWHRLQS